MSRLGLPCKGEGIFPQTPRHLRRAEQFVSKSTFRDLYDFKEGGRIQTH